MKKWLNGKIIEIKDDENEAFFRMYQDQIDVYSWVNAENIKTFSKDFMREFKDRFKWECGLEGEIVLMRKDENFWREITGKKKMYI